MLTRLNGRRLGSLVIAFVLLALALGACSAPTLGGGATPTPTPTPAAAAAPATPTTAPVSTATTASAAIATTAPAPSPTATGAAATPSATAGAPPTQPAARRATPDPDAGAVGQRLERAGIALTVRQVSGVKQYSGHPPRGDNFYLVLDVLVENTGLENYWRHELYYFSLIDAQGEAYVVNIFAPSPQLPVGEALARGGSVRGNIAFEVPPTAGPLFVSYGPEVAPGQYAVLQVKLDEAGVYAPTAAASAGTPGPSGTPAATPPSRPSPTTAARRTPSAAPSAVAADDWGPALAPLAGGRTYDDPAGRFSFRVPEEWAEIDTAQNDIAFALRSRQAVAGVGLEDTGEPNIGIERVRQEFDRELRGRPDYTQVGIDRVVVDGRRAYRQVLQRTDAEGTLQLVQVYLVEKGVVHILSFACPVDDFAEWAPVFDGIAGSYRVGR